MLEVGPPPVCLADGSRCEINYGTSSVAISGVRWTQYFDTSFTQACTFAWLPTGLKGSSRTGFKLSES